MSLKFFLVSKVCSRALGLVRSLSAAETEAVKTFNLGVNTENLWCFSRHPEVINELLPTILTVNNSCY